MEVCKVLEKGGGVIWV